MESLLAQSEARWECVLVDDGSTDGTLEMARSFAARDRRVRFVSCEHRGIVPSLNEGLRHCRGRFIARMDADDRMHPQRFSAQREALEVNSNWSAVGCHIELFPRKNLGKGRLSYEAWLNGIHTPERVRADAMIECPVAHPTLFARREVLVDFAYEDKGWPEDYDLILRWLGAGHRVGIVPRILLAWRESDRSLSRTGEAYGIDRFTHCKAHYLKAHFLGDRDSYVLWGYGGTGRSLRKALAARGCEPSCIVEVHPGRLGQAIRGAPVIPPQALPDLRRTNGPLRIIASVAGEGPRSLIRASLEAMGFVEGCDYVCAA